MRRKLRLLAVLAVMAVLTTGAYAFTNTNFVDSSNAGFGAGSISGYTVSDITYDLNATQINSIDGVSFSLTGVGGTSNEPTEITVNFVRAPNEGTTVYNLSGGDCNITNAASPWQVSCTVDEYAASISSMKIGAAE